MLCFDNIKFLTIFHQVIEALWRQQWSSIDGLGALIISPTRELVSRKMPPTL